MKYKIQLVFRHTDKEHSSSKANWEGNLGYKNPAT